MSQLQHQSRQAVDDPGPQAAFFAQFDFRPAHRGALGLEREFFVVNAQGQPVPCAQAVLDGLARQGCEGWEPELSACQLEVKTPPRFRLAELASDLRRQDAQGRAAADALGLSICAMEVAPDDMPLDVYPDPRYRKIAAGLDADTLLAGCQLAATHIHIGVADLDEALRVYARLRAALPTLMQHGDHSNGRRLLRYRKMAPLWEPPEIHSPLHFYELALAQGFALPPQTARDCWWVLRINPVGTVEVRVFGAEPQHQRILGWVQQVEQLAGLDAKTHVSA